MNVEQMKKQYKNDPGAFIEAYNFELNEKKRKIMWKVITHKA